MVLPMDVRGKCAIQQTEIVHHLKYGKGQIIRGAVAGSGSALYKDVY